MTTLCRHCGKPEAEHCAFEVDSAEGDDRVFPAGCVCGRTAWAFTPYPICNRYVGSTVKWLDGCTRCMHDRACHKGKG